MKYQNIDMAVSICHRISELKKTLERLERTNDEKAIIISTDYLGSNVIIKQWESAKECNGVEDGMYHECIKEFIASVIKSTRARIEQLTAQLDKL